MLLVTAGFLPCLHTKVQGMKEVRPHCRCACFSMRQERISCNCSLAPLWASRTPACRRSLAAALSSDRPSAPCLRKGRDGLLRRPACRGVRRIQPQHGPGDACVCVCVCVCVFMATVGLHQARAPASPPAHTATTRWISRLRPRRQVLRQECWCSFPTGPRRE